MFNECGISTPTRQRRGRGFRRDLSGGVNQRLDYNFLLDVIKSMPDWEFRFCGRAIESDGWERLLALPNVRYLGHLHPDDLARHMCAETVGIIPFVQDQVIRNSPSLKVYEYVACRLPVFTVPFTSLQRESELMTEAATAADCEAAIRAVADSRFHAATLERCREVPLVNSYVRTFLDVCEALIGAREVLLRSSKRLRIGMLYDSVGSMHVSTIREHLEAFRKNSAHDFTLIPATASYWPQSPVKMQSTVEVGIFDVVVFYYSIGLSIADHFEEGLVRQLGRFNGLKALFN